MVKLCIIGQDQQALAVIIQPADRINIFRYFTVIRKRAFTMLSRELREYKVRFIDDKVAMHFNKKSPVKNQALIYGWVSKYQEINFPTQY